MIVDLLVTVLFGILNAVFSLLPAAEVGEHTGTTYGSATNADMVAQVIGVLHIFIDVRILFWVLAGILACRFAVVAVQFVRWLWGVIPFKSS